MAEAQSADEARRRLFLSIRNGESRSKVKAAVAALVSIEGRGTGCLDDSVTEDGETLLSLAIAQGCRGDIIDVLLGEGGGESVSVNSSGGPSGLSPLYLACEAGHGDVVRQLLFAGAAVNRASLTTGETPLFVASKRGDATVAKLLLKQAGCLVDKPNADGLTPLCVACGQGHQSIVRLLLRSRASVEPAKRKQQSEEEAQSEEAPSPSTTRWPLLAACEGGHEAVVDILLAHGARTAPLGTRRGAPTAVSVASAHGHSALASRLIRVSGANTPASAAGGVPSPISTTADGQPQPPCPAAATAAQSAVAAPAADATAATPSAASGPPASAKGSGYASSQRDVTVLHEARQGAPLHLSAPLH